MPVFFVRVVAFVIDGVVLGIFGVPLAAAGYFGIRAGLMVLGKTTPIETDESFLEIVMIAWFLMATVYFTMLHRSHGQTIGKALLGLYVRTPAPRRRRGSGGRCSERSAMPRVELLRSRLSARRHDATEARLARFPRRDVRRARPGRPAGGLPHDREPSSDRRRHGSAAGRSIPTRTRRSRSCSRPRSAATSSG
jgi:hypothetical protein